MATKYFRKYSRTLLMVFMSLLLVAFLIPQGVQSCGSATGMNQKIGYAATFDQNVTFQHITQADADRRILARVFGPSMEAMDPIDYHLAVAEARRAGVKVGQEQVKQILSRGQFTADSLANLQKISGRSYPDIYGVIGDWLSVIRLLDIQMDAAGESLPRLKATFRDRQQKLDALVSTINSKAFESLVGEPTEEQLAALFAEGRDRIPAHTDEKLQFGYKLPDRIQIEYLTIDPKSMEATMRLRPAEVREYFELNRDKYTKAAPATDTQAAATPPQRVPMTFEEAEEQVRKDARTDKAIREAQRIINEIQDEAERPWIGAGRDEANIRKQPAGDLVSFEALRDKFASEAKIKITYRRTNLVDRNSLRQEFGVSQPFYMDVQPPVEIAQLAFMVKGLVTPKPGDTATVLNINEPSPVLMTRLLGSRQMRPNQPYLFRVLQVAPAAPAETMTDIRDRLVADWKEQRAYEMAAEHARKLADRAREVGLEAAVAEAQELRDILAKAETPESAPEGTPSTQNYTRDLQPTKPMQFDRRFAVVNNAIMPTVSAKVFEALDSTDPATQPARRTILVSQATQGRWTLVEVRGVQPLYADEFDAMRDQLVFSTQSQERSQIGSGWLASENIRKRAGYQPVAP